MPDILLTEQDYEIPGYITCEELQTSKAFIIRKNFLTAHEACAPSVFPYEENQAFIQKAVSYIQKAIRDCT